MMKVSSSYGFFIAFAHVGLLLLIAPGTVSSSQSQFCDECTPKIYDITQRLPIAGIPTWKNTELRSVMKNDGLILTGSKLVTGKILMGNHWGSHVDAPIHSVNYYRDFAMYSVDALKLNTLMGPVLVVDTPRDSNITAAVLQSLNLPAGLKRIIFRTANTDRRLMEEKVYFSDYTGFTIDAASWLVNNTAIDFVGIDYMSIARTDDIVPVHDLLFSRKSIIPVECLKLDEVKPGPHTVYCLPLKLAAEGAPVRCILVE